MGTIRKTISIRSLDDDIDFDLVSKFYNELIFPTFGGVAEHMDDLETWKDLLFSPSPPTYRLFLDIVVIENESKIGDNDGHSSQQQQQKQQIIGGSMFEFFPNSLCGILSYIVVHELHRGRGIAQSLVHQMKDTLNQYATEITEGKEKKIRHLFLETNLPPLEQNPNIFSDSELIQLYKESLLLLGEHHHSESFEAWEKRMKFFSRLGFGVLDFPYIQPPLGEGKDPAFNLLLLAHMPSSPSPPLLLCDTTPSSQQQQQQQQKDTPDSVGVNPQTLATFLEEFTDSCCVLMDETSHSIQVTQNLKKRDSPLFPIPTELFGLRIRSQKDVPLSIKQLLEMGNDYLSRKNKKSINQKEGSFFQSSEQPQKTTENK